MKNIFILIILLIGGSSQAQDSLGNYPRHQFWIAIAGDYFFEQAEISAVGADILKVQDLPGFRIGASFSERFFKTFPGYMVLDAYYGIQGYKTRVAAPTLVTNGVPMREFNHQLQFMLGYEQRFKLKKDPFIQPFAALKAGLTIGFLNGWEHYAAGISVINQGVMVYAYGYEVYKQQGSGIIALPYEFSLGVNTPVGEQVKAKFYLAYSSSFPWYNNRKIDIVNMQDMNGETASASYREVRNYLTFGVQIGFNKKAK